MSRSNSSVVKMSGEVSELDEGSLVVGPEAERLQEFQKKSTEDVSDEATLFIGSKSELTEKGILVDGAVYGIDVMNPSSEEEAVLYADTLYGYLARRTHIDVEEEYFDVLNVLILSLLDESNTEIGDIQDRFNDSGLSSRTEVIGALEELSQDEEVRDFLFGSAENILTPSDVEELFASGSTIAVSSNSESAEFSGLGLYYFWRCIQESDIEDINIIIESVEQVNDTSQGILKALA